MSKLVISSKIRELRQNACYTQAEVSRMLNVQRQTYCNYENATRTPPLDTIIALAELYHVSVDYLVCGAESEAPEPVANIPQDAVAQKMLDEFSSLSEQDQREVLAFVRFKKMFSTDSIA